MLLNNLSMERKIYIVDIMNRDLVTIEKVGKEMTTGNLQAFQRLRKALTGANRDNINIPEIPPGAINAIADMGTLMLTAKLLLSFDELLDQHNFKIPVSSLDTVKFFSSWLGSYMLCSLTNVTDKKNQNYLEKIGESFSQLQKELESFGPSPKSWIQF